MHKQVWIIVALRVSARNEIPDSTFQLSHTLGTIVLLLMVRWLEVGKKSSSEAGESFQDFPYNVFTFPSRRVPESGSIMIWALSLVSAGLILLRHKQVKGGVRWPNLLMSPWLWCQH